MSKIPWTGVFPAAITHLHPDQSLNLPATAHHLNVLIESGVSGLIVCGSLGENQCLQPEEKRAVLQCAIDTAAGRVPVLSGVAEMSTQAAIRYPLSGTEREHVLKIIRDSLAQRPVVTSLAP